MDGTRPNMNITTALQMLLLDLTGSRGENISPFRILTWIHIRQFRHLLISQFSCKPLALISSFCETPTYLFLQESSSPCSHKGGFKGSGTPVLMFSPSFTEMFQLVASSGLSFAESGGLCPTEKALNKLLVRAGFPAFFLKLMGCLFPPSNPDLFTLPFSKNSQLNHSAKQ